MSPSIYAGRQIRVFISSTFRDMKEERDYLVKYTFPLLRKRCESRGVVWGEVDLRWGITDEAHAEDQVLPICLEAIHRCRPYFIGLLGERYGWVPEQISDELVDRQPWLREHRNQSITELEIQHGVLRHKALHGQAYFYFRDPAYLDQLSPDCTRSDFESESPEAQAKLTSLKARLRQAQAEGLCRVREPYPNLQTLGQWIFDDFTAMLDQQFPEGSQPDPLDRDALDHATFAQSRTQVYIGRQEYFERLDTHVEGNGPPLVVLGDSGIGKSALLANWFLRFQQTQPETFALIHFIGATPHSANWQMMLRRILGEFKRRFDIHDEIPADPNVLRSTFVNWLHQVAAKGRVVLILDALNQVEDREIFQDLVWLPSVIPGNIRLILSTLPGKALDNLATRGWSLLTVHPLQNAERRTLITEYLTQATKALSPARIDRITTAPQSANPLYLRILLNELRVHGSHETLEPTIEYYLAAETIPDLYGKVLARWERDYEGDTDLVGEALSHLWAARRGLSETEWRDLLGADSHPLPQTTFIPFLLAVETGLVNSSGLFTFAHDYLREAVQEAYVPTTKHRQAAHRNLADYFAQQPLTTRHVDERPWQLAEAGEWRNLAELLGAEPFFVEAWQINRHEVLRLWARMEQQSSERIMESYRIVKETIGTRSDTTFPDMVANLFQITGHLIEAGEISQALLDHARRSGGPTDLVCSLGNQACILQKLGNLEEALRLHKEAERLSRESADLAEWGRSLGNQAVILQKLGNLEEALRLNKEHEQLCRDEWGDPEELAGVLGNQAVILQKLGNLEEALRLHKEAEQLSRELGDPAGLATALRNQAGILQKRGDFDEALRLYKEAEQLSRELGDPTGLGHSLGDQAVILQKREDLDGALRLLREEERLCRKLGDQEGLAHSLGNQAKILLVRGDLDEALRLHKEEEQLCRKLDDLAGLASSLGNQAKTLLAHGDLEEALRLHKEEERLCQDLGDPKGCVISRINQAPIMFQQGKMAEGGQAIEEAYQLAMQHGLTALAQEIAAVVRGLRDTI